MTNLVTIEPEGVAPGLIADIEAVLEDAKAGKLSAVAIAKVYRDGSIGYTWSTPPCFALLLGSVTMMQYCMCRRKDDER